MRVARAASAVGVAALFIALVASPSSAQDRARRGAPSVRVYSQNGPGVESNYVTPALEVSEDAYVFAVSMDLDGQIQVLHPAFPGISVRILRHKQLRLQNFFAGFSQSGGTFDASGRYASYSDYNGGENDSRGTVIALVSRAPFNLERVEADGDWNMSAIRRLIDYRTPGSAAQALASYLGSKGEPIGRDYMRFASAGRHYYATNALYGCDLYYGGYSSGLAFSRVAVLARVAELRHAGQSVSIVGYDFCGMPIVAYGPSRSITGFRPPTPPGNPGDTIGARNRLPHSIPRSDPQAGNTPREAAIGYFPITRRAEPPRIGDATIIAPSRSGRDPGEILIDRRNEARGGELPERAGVPVERAAPTRTEPTVMGTQPAREYSRPVTHEAPPPPRSEPASGPDRSSPPPVVQERPESPPPPPPRVSEPHSKPMPDPVPPPRR